MSDEVIARSDGLATRRMIGLDQERARRPRPRRVPVPPFGEYEGRTGRRQYTCMVGIAVLRANAVLALGFVPTRQPERQGADASYRRGAAVSALAGHGLRAGTREE
jgi:hypothetical protein